MQLKTILRTAQATFRSRSTTNTNESSASTSKKSTLTSFMLVLSLLFSLWNGESWGQTYTVGTGTTTTYQLPINSFYGYSYNQSIYPASLLTAQGMTAGMQISQIKWNVQSTSGVTNNNNWTVYIGNTTATSFSTATSWIPTSSLTQVFSGTATWTTGWMTINLSTPFTWNGQNLVIGVDENSASYTSYTYFYYSVGAANSSILYYSDVTNPSPAAPPSASTRNTYLPNIQLVTPCSAPTTQASNITASSVSSVGATINWTNGNGGGRVVYINSTNSFTNPTNGSSPTASTVWANTGQQCIYNGTGSSPISVTGLSASTTYYVRVYEYCSPDLNYQTATANGNSNSFTTAAPSPTISLNPSILPFGNYCVNGTSSAQSFNLSGVYLTPLNASITLTAPSGFGISTSSTGPFTSSLSLSASNGSIASTPIYVVFQPSALISYSGSVTTSGGGVSSPPSLSVTGTGITSASYLGASSSASASPSAVCLGSSSNLSVAISSGPVASYTAPAAVTYPTSDEDLGTVTITQGATTIISNTSVINSLTGSIGTATGTAGSYSNFTSFGPYAITRGVLYNFSLSSLTTGTGYGNSMAIYIDYNRNGVYTDAGEAVYVAGSTVTGAHTETGSFTVPTSAGLGLTRMLVVCNEGTISGPTMSISYGEREEYLLNILASGVSYSWSNGTSVVGTTNPLSATPSSTTAYTCTATVNGCPLVSNSTSITVNPLPTIAATAAQSTICLGTSTTLTGSGGTSYAWTPATNLSATTGAPTFTPSASGNNQTYTVTGTDANGCSNTAQVSVNVLAVPAVVSVTGTTPNCNNTVISASGGSGGSIYYQGSTSGGTSTATLSASQSVNATGTYYFRSYNGTCFGPQGSLAVVINTQPVITGHPSSTGETKCNLSQTFTPLTVTATGTNLTYQWYANSTASNSGGTLISGATSSSYVPSNTTVGTSYYYCVVSSASCPSTTSNVSGAIIVITSPAAPTVSPATLTVNVGASATVTATSNPNNTGTTFRWWNAATSGNQVDPDVTTPGLDDAVFNSYQAQVSPPSPNNSPTPNVAFCTPSTNYTYYVEEFDGTCPSLRTPVVINTNPLVSSSSSNNLICQSGASITLTANITQAMGSQIQWQYATNASGTANPPVNNNLLPGDFTNLSPNGNSTIISVSPSVSTTYQLNTASPFMPFGCTNATFNSTLVSPASTQQSVLVYPSLDFTPNANPSSICIGGTTSLIPNTPSGNFTASCIAPVSSLSVPPSGAKILATGGVIQTLPAGVTVNSTSLDDNFWGNVPIGFNYNFFNQTASTVFIGSNGTIVVGVPGATGSTQYNFSGPPQGFPSSANPASTIAVAARDLHLAHGTLRYWTEGIAPTRRFIVQYDSLRTYSTCTTYGYQKAEAVFYETSGIIDIRVIAATNGSGGTTCSTNSFLKYIGLQDPNKTIGATAPNCNSNNVTLTQNYWNGINQEIFPNSPKTWRFSPPANYNIKWYQGTTISGPLLATYNYSSTLSASAYNYNTLSSQSGTAGQLNYTVSATNTNTNCPSAQTLAITINALPSAPISGGNVTACNNASSTTLTATAPVGCVVEWFSNSTGSGAPLATGSSYTFTPSANAGTYTYYAFSRNSTTTCASSAGTPILLTVVTSPAAPVATTTSFTYCEGSTSAQLAASALSGNTLNWYSGTLGVNASSTAPTPSTATNVGSPFTFYATQTSGTNGCESNPTTFTVTVNNTPAAPTYANTVSGSGFTINPQGTIAYCQGSSTFPIWTSLGAANVLNNPSNNQIYWYYSAPTGNAGQTSAPVTPSSINPGSTTYYVSRQNTLTGCEGARVPVIVIVNPSLTPAVAISASSTTVCPGGSITYNAVPTNGGPAPSYIWFLNGTQVGTGSTYIQASPSSGNTIYATMVSNEPSCLFTPNATSATITLNNSSVTPSVSIIQNTGTTICANSSVTFSVANALNMGSAPSYAWAVNGVIVANTPTFTTTSLSNNAVVSLTMTSSLPSNCLTGGIAAATSQGITMTVTPVTAITAQPANASVCLGGSQSLSVSAIGTGTITYQWQSAATAAGPFTNISFASNTSAQLSTLSIPSVAGQLSYQLVATSSCGSATSSIATISINQATGITTQPQAVVACAGTSATFSVGAVGTGAISYQWRFNGSPITGATNASYSISAVNSANAGQYSVVVTATCGSVTSANAQLTVNPLTTISVQPIASLNLCDSSNLSLSVSASGTAPISYQWYRGNTAILGATSALYTDPIAVVSESGQYTVQVTGGCSTITSAASTVVVSPNTWITAQPVSYTGCALNPTSLSVTGLGANLQYQWSIGTNPSTAITGATSATYNLSNPQTSNSGSYTVTLTGTCGVQTSNIALVTINPVPSAGTINGGNSGVCVGSTINLTNLASGGVWSSSNPALGSISSTGVLTGISAGTITVTYTVTNSFGCVSTATKVIQVKGLPTAVIQTPLATSICQGESMNLLSSAAVSYLWSSGATTQSAAVNSSATGTVNYSVTVTGTNGCAATSTPLAITVIPVPTIASITGSGNFPNFCLGNASNLANATPNGLWSSSNTNVMTVNPNTGSANAISIGTATISYHVANIPGCLNPNPGTATASITVSTPPSAFITSNGSTTFCQGGSVVLTAPSGTGYNYLWSNGATTQTVTATTSGTFTVTVTATGGCSVTSLPTTVTVLPIPTATIYPTGAINICSGTNVTLSTGSAVSYAWSNGANTPTISVNTAGTYSVTLTGTNGCTATSALSTVTVTQVPSAVITANGPTNICDGGSVGLSVPTAGSYLWSNGATTQSISATSTGNYSVTATNGICSATSTPIYVNFNPVPSSTITASGPTTFCQGGNVTLSAPTGNSFTYLWTNGATTQSITVANSGSYGVTVSNSFNCSSTSTPISVVVNALPTASITAAGFTTICSGNSLSLTAATANAYLWSTGATTQTISVSLAGNYTVQAISAAGCTATSSVLALTVLPSPTAIITQASGTTFCQGGSVSISSTPASAYLWSNNQTTQSISATSSGVYSVLLTAANGCTATSNAITVNVLPIPTATIYPGTNVNICAGSTVTLSTGTAASYAWSNGANTPTITVGSNGTHTVTLTGSNGCTATSAITTVTVNPIPIATITASGSTNICSGTSVNLTAASAGSYLWSNGATTQTIAASLAGTYAVTVTTAGCSATSASTSVNVNPAPAANVTASGPTSFCQGGSVSFTANAGNGYSYLWSNGSTAASISATTSGNYSVTVTNQIGCSTTSTVNAVVVNPIPLATITAGGSTTICSGSSVSLSAPSGGTYLWNNGATTQAINAAAAGNYSVTVSTIAGCTATSSPTLISVNQLPSAAITSSGSTTFCQGGSVSLIANSGLSSYLWSNGTSGQSISASNSGIYSVQVTDANGCTATSNSIAVTVNQAPVAAVYPGTNVTICSGSSVTLSTNTASSYTWSNGSHAPTIQVNTGGTYFVTLTGSNGCSATSPLTTVAVTTTPTAAITSSGPTTICQGSNVTLSAPPAANTYLWNTGATTQSINVSLVGSYFVTVGSNGCSATSPSTFVSYNPVPTATVTASGPTTFCQGNSVTFSAPAGNGNTYLWNTGATTQSISTSTAGNFSVTVTNGYGCSTASTTSSVLVNPLPVLTPITGSSSICAGTQGQVSNVMTGGVYASSNLGVASIGQLNGQITGLTAGNSTISYVYTDANGCSNTVTYPVAIIAAPVATISAGGPTTFCQGGSVNLTASTGTAYVWNTGATTASITASTAGSYSVTVTGANGCSATSLPTTVNVLTPSPVSVINGANTVCVNSATGLTNATSGGVWTSSNPAVATISSAGIVTGVSAGTTTISYTINSTNGCQNAATKLMTVNAVPSTALTASGATTFCQGGNVQLTASTGSTYLWSSGETTASITASTSGNYNVTVTNVNGCSSVSTNQTITVNANPTAQISTNGSTNLCTGGSITLMATPSSSYLWSTGATTASITTSTAGSYTVTVTNANGCSATSTATNVVVNASPSATVTASGPTTICSGNNVVLTSTAGTGNSYQWTKNGVLISGATSNAYTANSSGSYAVIVTNAAGCSVTSVATPVSVVLASVANITASGSTSLCNNASVTLTATSGASYLWSNGATTQAITVNTAANYTVTVTNAQGCSATSVATPVVVNASPAATITAGGPTTFCQGSNVVLTASTGATYLWSNGATTSSITATTPGTYSVLITNASGCSATSAGTTVTVNAAPVATISASGSTTFCSGGSVTLTASPGASYLWSTGATTASITATTAGARTVTVTNAAGCSSTSAAINVVVNAMPTASITAGGATTICSGSNVTLTASAGSNYVWNNGATTASIVANTSGNYTVTVYNANGCSATSAPTTVTVNNPSVANISTSGPTTFCAGGSVNLTATTAASYLWSTGATTQSISVNTTGNYSVVLTNAAGCVSTSPTTAVTANALPTATITAGGATTFCQGGSVNLTASPGTSYVWSNGATGSSINVSAAGTYTVQISNNSGCTANSAATVVTVNTLPTASITAGGSLSICAGSSVNLTASTGVAYLWSNGATSATIAASNAGNYTVQVTNAAGCTSTSAVSSVVVNALPTPSIASVGSTTICQGASVTLTTANGSGLTYQWKNNGTNIPGATAASYVANTAGSYTVQVTNAAGCSNTTTATAVVVNALPSATISNSGSNTICAGSSVSLTASAGTAYAWSNGATTATIAVNASGNYSVSITNAAGCTSSASTAITVVTPTTASITASGPTSFCTGQNVVLTANSGASYLWSTGATTASITVSTTTNATVQVTYASGCVSTSPITAVTVNSLPAATITASGATSFCPGSSVTLTASNGSSYVWTNGSTSNSIVVSAAGSYGVSVTNAAGCVATSVPTVITVFAAPIASISTSGATTFCQGSTLNLTANTGSSYVWSNGATTASISVATSGNFTVTVTDVNGCSAVSSLVPVTVNALPVASIQANGPTTVCQGSTVVLTANGGTGFAWSNSETTASISVTTSGSYGVTVTNAAGCSSVVTPVAVTVNPVQVLSPIVGASNVCVGSSTTYTNSTSGGLWSSDNSAVASVNSTSGIVSGISTGSAIIKYQFVNASGCASEVTKVVTVNGIQPVSIAASGATNFCQGGSVTLTAPAGLNYNWTSGQTTQSITVNTSGTFGLSVSNAAGCSTSSSSVQVTVNPTPSFAINSTSNNLCQGSTLVLNASTTGANYAWSNGGTTQSILITSPGTYLLSITDANGCVGTASTTISNGINPIATVNAAGATTFCQGGNVTLSGAGGTSYLWNNGATTQNITVSTPGNYSVLVTNAAGCSSMSNATYVNVLQAPNAVISAYGPTTFCQGGSVTIATSGGTSYAWSNGSTAQSIVPTTTGTYSVIVTGANGCTATSNAISVTVNPTPTAVITPSGATTFCEGSSVNLVASGGTNYAWSNGPNTASITATTGGTYTVTVTNAGGCSDTETITVTVNEVPSAFIVASGATTFCQGGQVSLTAQAGNSYLWSNNATTQSISVANSGSYSVTILSPNGCSVSSNAIAVTVNQPSVSTVNATAFDSYTLNGILYTQPGTYVQTLTNAIGCDSTITLNLTLTVGIEEGSFTDVNVYPNPTSESFTIKTSAPLYGNYSVVDAQGKLVFEGELMGTETHVNISHIARGIYYLRIPELSEPMRVVKN